MTAKYMYFLLPCRRMLSRGRYKTSAHWQYLVRRYASSKSREKFRSTNALRDFEAKLAGVEEALVSWSFGKLPAAGAVK